MRVRAAKDHRLSSVIAHRPENLVSGISLCCDDVTQKYITKIPVGSVSRIT